MKCTTCKLHFVACDTCLQCWSCEYEADEVHRMLDELVAERELDKSIIDLGGEG